MPHQRFRRVELAPRVHTLHSLTDPHCDGQVAAMVARRVSLRYHPN